MSDILDGYTITRETASKYLNDATFRRAVDTVEKALRENYYDENFIIEAVKLAIHRNRNSTKQERPQ